MPRKEISDEKLLDMIRSILPSTSRHSARWAKADENRKVRRRMRMALDTEDAEETKVDLCEDTLLTYIVWSRRGADKLNHFMRWCESWTNGMTERQKLDAVRAVLPRNLIGDHAFGHWKQHVKYRSRRNGYLFDAGRKWQSRYDKTRHRLRQALSVDPGLPGRLNAAIEERKDVDEPRRMLLGAHDIDAFVNDVLDKCAYSKEARVLLDLLDEVERYASALHTPEIGTPVATLRHA